MRQFVLPNGTTVVLAPWDASAASVVVGLRGSGSRNDTRELRGRLHAGLNHFAEHVMFRASKRHPSWREFAQVLDRKSSNYNAFTDKSTVLFCLETYSRKIEPLIVLLADILRHPLLTKENIEAERERIRQECRVWDDEPGERVDLALDRLMFPDTCLAHPILGTEETVRRISIDQLRSYHRRMFVGRRLVVVIAGGFDPDRVAPIVSRAFQKFPTGLPPVQHHLHYDRFRGGLHLIRDQTKQLHCTIAWPTPGMNDPRRIAIGILRNMLTGRPSALLKLGLDADGHGYSSTDEFWCYEDVGQFSYYFPLSADHLSESLFIIGYHLQGLKSTLVPASELETSVDNLTIGVRGKFSEPWEAATFIAKSHINSGNFKTLRTYLQELRSVRRSHLRQVANDVFDQRRMTLIIRGPVNGLRRRDILYSVRH